MAWIDYRHQATNSWSVNIDNSLLNGIIFIDLKKAFDTSDHGIILRKLEYLLLKYIIYNGWVWSCKD